MSQAPPNLRAVFSKNKASEDYAIAIGDRIGKDLGREAQREFHDMKVPGSGDRTKGELRDDARELYDRKGVSLPSWLK